VRSHPEEQQGQGLVVCFAVVNPLQTKQTIVAALSAFAPQPLAAAAAALFEALGYGLTAEEIRIAEEASQ
jgi:hypothetical protein